MKKTLAFLLTALMLLSCMTIFASAEGVELRELIICDCDTAFGSFTLDTEEKTQGEASCSCVLDADRVNANEGIFADISDYDTLEFDLWVSDPAFFELTNQSQFELTSSGKCDVEEWAILLGDFINHIEGGEAKQGWNHLTFSYKDGAAGLNTSAVNFLRFYIVGVGGTDVASKAYTYKLDNVKVTNRYEMEAAAAAETVKPVIDLIKAIGLDGDVTAANYEAVKAATEAARAAYKDLTDIQKDVVSSDDYKLLTNAEKAIRAYEKALENPETKATETQANETKAAGNETEPKTDDEKTESSTGLIIGIVAAVVVIAAVVVFLCVKKKK